MANERKTLYLLDAMALAYRAHFIFVSRPLINSRGENTSATYGFVAALVKLIEDHTIENMAVVFDVIGSGGTFRDEMYPEYKAHRDPAPEDLIANIPRIKEVVRAMDIPVVEYEGVEADDVIGTLARQAEADGANVVIVSPDKDFMQLVSERISMLRPAYRGEGFNPVTPETFREKYGLEPEQFIDMLALMGDAADNVPGVPGIGEKTAIKLLKEFGSFENLLENADKVAAKRARENLQTYRDQAILSKRLVTILTDVPVKLTWDDFHRLNPDYPLLEELFGNLEFGSLHKRTIRVLQKNDGISPPLQQAMASEKALSATQASGVLSPTILAASSGSGSIQADLFGGGMSHATGLEAPAMPEVSYDPDAVEYTLVSNRTGCEKLADRLAGADWLAFDTETTSKDPMLASLVGISLSVKEGEAWYVPTPMPDGTSTEDVIELLGPVINSAEVKVGQNIKYDLIVLARHGLEITGRLFDTMIAHYLLSPEDPHGMDALARRYLGYDPIPISSLIGKGKSQLSMRDVPIENVSPYACEDADITLRLARQFELKIAGTSAQKIAEEIEYPLIKVLADMEMTGICLDRHVLSTLSAEMGEALAEAEHQIYEKAGESFNIASMQQLGRILFEKLELPVISKTSKGKPSTRESVLKELATEHELPGLILDWRELAKLKNTYVDTLPELVHPETGRIHTTYSQTIAATGRLSSNKPNLQNIPIRTARGREIRKAFIPAPGHVLMSADYAQIELRILAALSGDKALRAAFSNGEDIHSATAARVLNIPQADVTREQRNRAKEVNYGIPYGISAFGLAQRLRCPQAEARDLIESYQRAYPQVTTFLSMQVERARERGFVETVLGRRRYVPDIQARNRNVRSFAERVAVNMPIQGTQADMIKIAMINIHRIMSEEEYQSKLLLQVHDELVFEVLPAEEGKMRALVEEQMANALPMDVLIEVDIQTGKNWLEAH